MDFSLDSLEYHRLKELLARYVSTEAARSLLSELKPSTDEMFLDGEHAITAEAMTYLREIRISFMEIPLLPSALHKLNETGSILDVTEIEAIQSFLSQIEGIR